MVGGIAALSGGVALVISGYNMNGEILGYNTWGEPQYATNHSAEVLKLAGAVIALFGVHCLFRMRHNRQMEFLFSYSDGPSLAGRKFTMEPVPGLHIKIPIGK